MKQAVKQETEEVRYARDLREMVDEIKAEFRDPQYHYGAKIRDGLSLVLVYARYKGGFGTTEQRALVGQMARDAASLIVHGLREDLLDHTLVYTPLLYRVLADLTDNGYDFGWVQGEWRPIKQVLEFHALEREKAEKATEALRKKRARAGVA